MTVPTQIDGDAPVLARHETLVQAPIDAIWRLHIAVDEWPTWQKDITVANLAGRFEPGASPHTWASRCALSAFAALTPRCVRDARCGPSRCIAFELQ